MAKITGTQCDVCKKVETDDTSTWLTVKPNVQSGTHEQGAFDVCGNDCLIKLGRMRKGDEAPTRKTWTDEQKLEIVAYAETHGVKQAAEAFGVPDVTPIYKWRKALEAS